MKQYANSVLSSLAPLITKASRRKLILCYHRFSAPDYADPFYTPVATTPAAELDKQLNWLKQFVDFVPLNDLQTDLKPSPGKRWQVAITIDDGYQDVIDLALPVLKKHQIPVTWFIATRPVSDPQWLPWWDMSAWLSRCPEGKIQLNNKILNNQNLSDEFDADNFDLRDKFDLSVPAERQQLRNQLRFIAHHTGHQQAADVVSQIQQQLNIPANAFCRPEGLLTAQQNFDVSLAPHTHHHSNLSLLNADDQKKEIEMSRDHLQQWGIQPLNWLAYPFGKPSARTTETPALAESLGFHGAVTTEIDYVRESSHRYQLPRISVDGRWNIKAFRSRVLFAPLIQSIKRLKR